MSDRLEAPRIVAVDVVKAAAIVTVVWIHCFQRIGATTATVSRLTLMTRFAVPAFFLAAGFLAAAGARPIDARALRRRLLRLAIPYLVGSLAAILYYWVALGWRPGPRWVVFQLLTGSAFGIYYFVPVLFGATLLGALLTRTPRWSKPLAAILVLVGYLYEARLLPLPSEFWDFRNPLRWWGYFAVGFVLGDDWPRLGSLTVRLRVSVGGGLLAASAAMLAFHWLSMPTSWTPAEGRLQYAMIYALTLGILFVSSPLAAAPRARQLAEGSYAIYLFHLFFVDLAMALPWLGYPLRNWTALVLGVAAPLGMRGAGRRLLGERARLLLG